MKNFLAVDVLHCSEDASDQKLSLVLGKTLDVREPAPEISSGQQVHYEIEVIPIIEGRAHVGDKRRSQAFKYFALIEHIVYAFFHDDQGLAHFLHSVEFLGTD